MQSFRFKLVSSRPTKRKKVSVVRVPCRKYYHILKRKSKSTSKSSRYVTDDVWLEIFLRHPVDTVQRIKCVSKPWHAIISSTQFIRQYIKYKESLPPRKVQDFSLYWCQDHADFIGVGGHFELCQLNDTLLSSSKLFDSSLDFLPKLRDGPVTFMVKSVSHGLTLCRMDFRSTNMFHYPRMYCVCNPLTKKWVELPPLPEDFIYDKPGPAGLVCQCDPLDTYKVEKFTVFELEWSPQDKSFVTHVFSSETGCWVRHRVYVGDCKLGWSHEPAAVFHNGNGMFYWDANHFVVAYDPINAPNKCKIIDLPPELRNHISHDIHYSQGKIRLSTVTRVNLVVITTCLVWELVEEENFITWNVIHKFSCHPITSQFQNIDFFSHTNKEIVCLRLMSPGLVIIYNTEKDSVEHVVVVPKENGKVMFNIPFCLTSWPTLIPQLALIHQV